MPAAQLPPDQSIFSADWDCAQSHSREYAAACDPLCRKPVLIQTSWSTTLQFVLFVHFIRAYLCRTTSRNVALGNRLPYNYILTSKIDRAICKIRRKHDKFYLISIFSPIFGQKIPSVIFRTEGYFSYISRLIYSGEVCIFLKRRGYFSGVSCVFCRRTMARETSSNGTV